MTEQQLNQPELNTELSNIDQPISFAEEQFNKISDSFVEKNVQLDESVLEGYFDEKTIKNIKTSFELPIEEEKIKVYEDEQGNLYDTGKTYEDAIENLKLDGVDPIVDEEKQKKIQELDQQRQLQKDSVVQEADKLIGEGKLKSKRRDKYIEKRNNEIDEAFKPKYVEIDEDIQKEYKKLPRLSKVYRIAVKEFDNNLNKIQKQLEKARSGNIIEDYKDWVYKVSDPTFLEKDTATRSKGVKTVHDFAKAYEDGKVNEGDVIMGWNTPGQRYLIDSPYSTYSLPVFYKADVDQNGNKVINIVNAYKDPITGEVVGALRKERQPELQSALVDSNYTYLTGYDNLISGVDEKASKGELTEVEANQKKAFYKEKRSVIMKDNQQAFSELMADKKISRDVKLMLIASTYPKEFAEKLSELSTKEKKTISDLVLKLPGIALTLPFKEAELSAEFMSEQLSNLTKWMQGRPDAEMPMGVLPLIMKKNPKLIESIQKTIDGAGNRKNKYLTSISGMADLLDVANMELENPDIQSNIKVVSGILGNINQAVTDLSAKYKDTLNSNLEFRNGFSRLLNSRGYISAISEAQKMFSDMESNPDPKYREAYRFLRLKEHITKKGVEGLSQDDLNFIKEKSKFTVDRNGKVVSYVNQNKDLLNKVFEDSKLASEAYNKAMELYPTQEINDYRLKNEPAIMAKMGEYAAMRDMFINSGIFDPKVMFMLKKFEDINTTLNSGTGTYRNYAFPMFSQDVAPAKNALLSTTGIGQAAGFGINIINTVSDILSKASKTLNIVTRPVYEDATLNETYLTKSIQDYKRYLESSWQDTGNWSIDIFAKIGAALPQMAAFVGSFVAGGPAGGAAYLGLTMTGDMMQQAASAGLELDGQIAYALLSIGIEFSSELITSETALLGAATKGRKSVLTREIVGKILNVSTRREALKEYARLIYRATKTGVIRGSLESFEEEVANKGMFLLEKYTDTFHNVTFNPKVFTLQESLDNLVTMIGTGAIFTGAVNLFKKKATVEKQAEKEFKKEGMGSTEAAILSTVVTPEGLTEMLNLVNQIETGKINSNTVNQETYRYLVDVAIPVGMANSFSQFPNASIQGRVVALKNFIEINKVNELLNQNQITPENAKEAMSQYAENAQKALTDQKYAEEQFGMTNDDMANMITEYVGMSDLMRNETGMMQGVSQQKQAQAALATQQPQYAPIERQEFVDALSAIMLSDVKRKSERTQQQRLISQNPVQYLNYSIENLKNQIDLAQDNYNAVSQVRTAASELTKIEGLQNKLKALEDIKQRYIKTQQNATKISEGEIESGTQPSGVVQRPGTQEGQLEEGERARSERETAQRSADYRNSNFGSQAQQAVQAIRALPEKSNITQTYLNGMQPGQEVQFMDEVSSQVLIDEAAAVRQFGQPVVDAAKQYINETGFTTSLPVVSRVQSEMADNAVKIAQQELNTAVESMKKALSAVNKSSVKKLVEQLQKAFPAVKVVMDKKGFNEAMQDEAARDLMTKGGIIYGRMKDGTVFLNPDFLNYNTPIHEFSHVWINVASVLFPDVYNKGLELIRDSEYMEAVRQDPLYSGLSTEQMEIEALATAIGDRGEQFVNDAQKQGFKKWLTRLLRKIAQYAGILGLSKSQLDTLSLDTYLNMAAASVLGGQQITEQVPQGDEFAAKRTPIVNAMKTLAESVIKNEVSKGKSLDEAVVSARSRLTSFAISKLNDYESYIFSKEGEMSLVDKIIDDVVTDVNQEQRRKERELKLAPVYATSQGQKIVDIANKKAAQIAESNKGKKTGRITAKKAYEEVLQDVKNAIDELYNAKDYPAGVSWINMMSLAPAIATDAVNASFPAAQRVKEADVIMSTSEFIRNAIFNQISAIRDVKKRNEAIIKAVKDILKEMSSMYGRGLRLTASDVKNILTEINDSVFSNMDLMQATQDASNAISEIIESKYKKLLVEKTKDLIDKIRSQSQKGRFGDGLLRDNINKNILTISPQEWVKSSATLEDIDLFNQNLRNIIDGKFDSVQPAIDTAQGIQINNQNRITNEYKSILNSMNNIIRKVTNDMLDFSDYPTLVRLQKVIENIENNIGAVSGLTQEQKDKLNEKYQDLEAVLPAPIEDIIQQKENEIRTTTNMLVSQVREDLESEDSDIRYKIKNPLLLNQFIRLMGSLTENYLSSLSPKELLSLTGALNEVSIYGNYGNRAYNEYVKAAFFNIKDKSKKWGKNISSKRGNLTAPGITNRFARFIREFTNVEGGVPSATNISKNLQLLRFATMDIELFTGYDDFEMGFIESTILGPMAAAIDAATSKAQTQLEDLKQAMILLSDKDNYDVIKKAIADVDRNYGEGMSLQFAAIKGRIKKGFGNNFYNEISVRMAAIVAHQIDHISNLKEGESPIDIVLQRNILKDLQDYDGRTMSEHFRGQVGAYATMASSDANYLYDSIAYSALTAGGTRKLDELNHQELLDLLTDKQREALSMWREHIAKTQNLVEAAMVAKGNMQALIKNYFPRRVYSEKGVSEIENAETYLNGQFEPIGLRDGQLQQRTGEKGSLDLDGNRVLYNNMKALHLMNEVKPYLDYIKGMGAAIEDLTQEGDIFAAQFVKGVNLYAEEKLKSVLLKNDQAINNNYGAFFRGLSAIQSFSAKMWLISVSRQLFADFPANIAKMSVALAFANKKLNNQTLSVINPKGVRYKTDKGKFVWDDYMKIAQFTGSPVVRTMSMYSDNFLYEYRKSAEQLQRESGVASWQDMRIKKLSWMSRFEESYKKLTGEYFDHAAFEDERGVYRATNMLAVERASAAADSFVDRQYGLPSFTRQSIRIQLLAPFVGRGLRNMFGRYSKSGKIFSVGRDNSVTAITGFLQGYPTVQYSLFTNYMRHAMSLNSGLSFSKRAELLSRGILEGIMPAFLYTAARSFAAIGFTTMAGAIFAAAGSPDEEEKMYKEAENKDFMEKQLYKMKLKLNDQNEKIFTNLINAFASTAIDPQVSFAWRLGIGFALFKLYSEKAIGELSKSGLKKDEISKRKRVIRDFESSFFDIYNVRPISVFGNDDYETAIKRHYKAGEATKGWESLFMTLTSSQALFDIVKSGTTAWDLSVASLDDPRLSQKEIAIASVMQAYGIIFANVILGGKLGPFLSMISGDVNKFSKAMLKDLEDEMIKYEREEKSKKPIKARKGGGFRPRSAPFKPIRR